MTPQPSPNTIRATAAALARAALLDDRITAADTGRIRAWSEVLDPYAFTQTELLAGVTRHYTAPRVDPIRVGDLIDNTREIRRQTAEHDKGQPPPYTPIDTQLGLPIGSADGQPIPAAYALNNAINRPCPRCHTTPGQPCKNTHTNNERKIPCIERTKKT